MVVETCLFNRYPRAVNVQFFFDVDASKGWPLNKICLVKFDFWGLFLAIASSCSDSRIFS